VNASKTRCLFERLIEIADVDKNILYYHFKLVLTDVDGQNETELDIPLPK
jgi:hypothetical protein